MLHRLRRLIRASPRQSLLRLVWFNLCRAACLIWFVVFYRYRTRGRKYLPRQGAVLIVSNHQSFLDPVVVGLAVGLRPMYALARASLYRGPVAWLIRSLNGIAVQRGEADTKAMRRCIEVLKEGSMLSIFPEGTRSRDGSIGPFKGGTLLLVRRARPVVVPLGIDGSGAIWPPGRRLPKLFGRVRAAIGEPIDADALLAMAPEAALALLREKVEALQASVAGKRG